MNHKNVFIFIFASFIAGIAAASALGQDVSTRAENRLPRLMPGLATAQQSADLAAIVNQRLDAVHAREGDQVKKGQLLATLDNGIARAEFEAAKAIADDVSQIEVAKIDLKEAKSKLARMEEAMTSGASNRAEVRVARNNYEKSLAELRLQESRQLRAIKSAETARHRMEAFNIRAPFDGVVTRQHISVGNMVAPGKPVFSVVDADQLRIELNMPLELFGKMTKGRTYELAGGFPVDQTIQAQLEFVSPAIDAAAQTFRCVFTVDNQELRLPAGFPVQLSSTQLQTILSTQPIASN